MRPGRLMISAAGSGYGKSVVAMGLLKALKERGLAVQSFKCGPDYIDPGFHTRVLGISCRNLDTWLMGREEVLQEAENAERSGFLCIAEGAMGLYDGLGKTVEHSAFSIAVLCSMPVLAVLDAGRDESCADQLWNLLAGDSRKMIRGILINRCEEGRYQKILQELDAMISGRGKETAPVTCGFLPPLLEAGFESRHLGLVGAEEIDDFALRLRKIALALEEGGCVDAVLDLMRKASGGRSTCGLQEKDAGQDHAAHRQETGAVCRIAVAKDEAFSFFYEKSLENLEKAGAQLCFFSPIHDLSLPDGVCGLYLPGGYPELHLRELEENASMRNAVRGAVQNGMPTVAECGGFLYLGEELCDETGYPYRMAGVLKGRASRQKKLVRFGYLELTQDRGKSLLFREGETVHAHEFHYWDSTCSGEDLLAVKRTKDMTWRCAYVSPVLYAAFPHLYLNTVRAERFAAACAAYRISCVEKGNVV